MKTTRTTGHFQLWSMLLFAIVTVLSCNDQEAINNVNTLARQQLPTPFEQSEVLYSSAHSILDSVYHDNPLVPVSKIFGSNKKALKIKKI